MYNAHLITLRNAKQIPEIPSGGLGYGDCHTNHVRYLVVQRMGKTWGEVNSLNQSLGITTCLLNTIESLHQLHLIYCDFKPQNVMIDDEENPTLV